MADKNLTVKIRGDNRGLSRSLTSARSQVGKFGGFLKGFGARFGLLGAGLVGTAAVAAPLKLFSDATAEIDKIAKLAKAFGLSAEQVQVFERVAELGGTNLEGLLKVYGQLSKAMLQFARDGSGAGAKAFKELGISAEQIDAAFKKGPVATIDLFTRSLEKIEDPVRKAAVAQEILGSRGLKALPALSDAAAQFAQALKDIKELGLGLTPEDTKSVEDYNDAWARVGNTLTNIKRKIGADLSAELEPAVLRIEEALENFLKGEGGPVAQPLGAAVNRGMQALQERFPHAAGAIARSPAGLLVNAVKLAAAAFEHGFEGAIDRVTGRVAGGLRGAGSLLGFPLTGGALAELVSGPAGVDRGALPAAGAGSINGQSFKSFTRTNESQLTELQTLNRNMKSFIINERTGVRTAVAAP